MSVFSDVIQLHLSCLLKPFVYFLVFGVLGGCVLVWGFWFIDTYTRRDTHTIRELAPLVSDFGLV